MGQLYELLKWVYFLIAVIVWILFLRWNYVLTDDSFKVACYIAMPLFLLFSGVMLCYLAGNLYILKNDVQDSKLQDKIYIKTFMAGIILGIAFSLIFIFYY